MATLLDIVDPHIVVNGKVVASSSLSPAALKTYVLNHPTVLSPGWIVSGTEIVQKPQATSAVSMVHAATQPALPGPPAPTAPMVGIGPSGQGQVNGTSVGNQQINIGGAGPGTVTLGPTAAPTQTFTSPTQQPVTAPVAPVAPTTDTPSPKPQRPDAPTIGQFSGYQDPQYWLDLANMRQQLGLIQNRDGSLISQASQAKLAGLGQHIDPVTLKPVATGGQTMYDVLAGQQQGADAFSVSRARSAAARQGVTRSGFWDRTAGNLASQSANAYDQLVRNYGTDLNDNRSAAYQANQAQGGLLSQYQQAQANIAQAAAGRGLSTALDHYNQTYAGYT